MKKLILILFTLTPYYSFSQTIDDVPLASIDVPYIEVKTLHSGIFTNKVNIFIDYGQLVSYGNDMNKQVIRGEDGKAIKFNSSIGAVNYLYNYGYDLRSSYTGSFQGFEVTAYIMEKVE